MSTECTVYFAGGPSSSGCGCDAAFLAFEEGRALGAQMQHQVRIEDGLRRGDATGSIEDFLGEQMRMAAAGDIDQMVAGEGGGDDVARRVESGSLFVKQTVKNLDDLVTITLAGRCRGHLSR